MLRHNHPYKIEYSRNTTGEARNATTGSTNTGPFHNHCIVDENNLEMAKVLINSEKMFATSNRFSSQYYLSILYYIQLLIILDTIFVYKK